MVQLQFLLLSVLSFCTGIAPLPLPAGLPADGHVVRVEGWRALYRGVDYTRVECDAPRPMRLHILRVDLTDPDIRFFVNPSNGPRPLDVDATRVSTFLTTYGLQVAINGGPYQPFQQVLEGSPQWIEGLAVSNGDCYANRKSFHVHMLITRDNHVRFAEKSDQLDDVYNAISGYQWLLKGGKVACGYGSDRHPRTAAGVSADGRTLFLLIVDGRLRGYSEGATCADLAAWFTVLGAADAINLDGGGSTTLAIADPATGVRLLNSPIDTNLPGVERVVGNCLGIYAAPVTEPITATRPGHRR